MTGLCVADVSTGELNVTQLSGGSTAQKLCSELGKFEPHEILINSGTLSLSGLDAFIKNRLNASVELLDDAKFAYDDALATVNVQFSPQEIDNSHLLSYPATVMALGALIHYIYATQMAGEAEENGEGVAKIECFDRIHYYVGDIYMNVDVSTRRNLELTETMRTKSKKGSLLWVLDKTRTPMGKRMIRGIIERPLVNPVTIQARQNAVDELCGDSILRDDIIQALRGISDIERLMTRIVYGSANAREIRALAYAADALPTVKESIKTMKSGELKDICRSIDTLSDIRDLVEHAIVDEPPLTVREGGMIKPGYCADLDALQGDMSGGKDFIASIEEKERERTGIQRLKVGYNRVFGYYIEVSNASKDLVPKEYIRKQTLTNCERYITEPVSMCGAPLPMWRCATITPARWSTPPAKSSSRTAVTPLWKKSRTSSSSPTTCISTTAKTASPLSPDPTWRANPPICGRSPSLRSWRSAAASSPRAAPRSAWWTASSPVWARRMTSRRDSPLLWWR